SSPRGAVAPGVKSFIHFLLCAASLSGPTLVLDHTGRELTWCIAVCCRYPDVPGHFRVQRRAKVGAVERVNTGLLGYPFQRLCFAWHNEYFRIQGALDGKAVGNVPILLEVCDVKVHLVANAHPFDIVRGKVRPDRSHIHVDFLTVAFNAGLPLTLRSV